MPHIKRYILLSVLALFLCQCNLLQDDSTDDSTSGFLKEGAYLGEYWPTDAWRECAPEEVGMIPERLESVYGYAANPNLNTHAILIVRRGYVVAEAYFEPFAADRRHESFSLAKGFTGALIGIALREGFLGGVHDKAYLFLPAWQTPSTPARKRRITIRHLLTMTSGLDWDEDNTSADDNDVYGMATSWDYLQYAAGRTASHEPGEVWNYSSGDAMLLSGIVQNATGLTASEFARVYLLEPLGLTGVGWEADPAGHTIGAWGITATAREYAKFAFLFLKHGRWQGVQRVPESWVIDSTSAASTTIDFYGYQWWLAPALSGFSPVVIPADTFMALGLFTQQIFVLPSKDLIVVRLGDDIDPSPADWDEVTFLTMILNAVTD